MDRWRGAGVRLGLARGAPAQPSRLAHQILVALVMASRRRPIHGRARLTTMLRVVVAAHAAEVALGRGVTSRDLVEFLARVDGLRERTVLAGIAEARECGAFEPGTCRVTDGGRRFISIRGAA